MRRVHVSVAQNSTGYLHEKSESHIHKNKAAKRIRVGVSRRAQDRMGVVRRREEKKGRESRMYKRPTERQDSAHPECGVIVEELLLPTVQSPCKT